MNLLLLYLLLSKATFTSFSGLTSLPVVRNDLVVTHQVLTDRQLNAAVVAGRTMPGPNGAYVVSVGYFVRGVPGAIAGWLAMVTPAFVIIPLVAYASQRAETPRVRRMIQGVMLAAAGLVAATTIPLARDSLDGPLALAVTCGSFLTVAFTRRDTLWIIGGSAAAGIAGALLSGRIPL